MSTTFDIELEEYVRYGRQMILPEIGKAGQLRLKASAVLIVGMGGLGCPSVAYLAGAGVGCIGMIDDDVVSLSNCHRQILYNAEHIGHSKVSTAALFVKGLNPSIKVNTYHDLLTRANVRRVFEKYQLVLDCTDNQSTRYLISDACVLLKIPLVSGSALKTEGQLAVYNYKGGPCYRCLFPIPSPVASVQSCSDAGVLGPVVGVIGVLQALEALKIIIGHQSGNSPADVTSLSSYVPTLTLFSAFAALPWRTIKLRKKKEQCSACGLVPSITFENIGLHEVQQSVSTEEHLNLQNLASIKERIDCQDIANFDGLIVDVRDSTQFGITSLPGSINVPIDTIHVFDPPVETTAMLIVCRQGIDSQKAVPIFRSRYPSIYIRDLRGGLKAYALYNPDFPIY